MPKQKTRKSAAKRFKVSSSGKIRHAKTRRGHLLSKKSASRKRRLKKRVEVDATARKRAKRMLGL
jgi:large subunit ribosomal protein L35